MPAGVASADLAEPPGAGDEVPKSSDSDSMSGSEPDSAAPSEEGPQELVSSSPDAVSVSDDDMAVPPEEGGGELRSSSSESLSASRGLRASWGGEGLEQTALDISSWVWPQLRDMAGGST